MVTAIYRYNRFGSTVKKKAEIYYKEILFYVNDSSTVTVNMGINHSSAEQDLELTHILPCI